MYKLIFSLLLIFCIICCSGEFDGKVVSINFQDGRSFKGVVLTYKEHEFIKLDEIHWLKKERTGRELHIPLKDLKYHIAVLANSYEEFDPFK